MYHYEKVLKASGILRFVSSACILRRHWSEYVGRVNRTFVLLVKLMFCEAQLLEGPLALNPGFFFLFKNLTSDNFLCYF